MKGLDNCHMSDRRPHIPTALVQEVQSTGKCAYCGVTVDGRGLHDIHHVDGNSSNNKIENLIYLCSKPYNNCHLIKGHLGNNKKINNNLIKEIKMKNTSHILRALHFAVRRGEFGATPWDRINLPLNKEDNPPKTASWKFSRPVESYIDGETQEFVDSKPFIDLFIEAVRDKELTPTQIYEKYINPLVDLNNKYPIKNDLGEVVDNIYGQKNSSDNRMYRKIIDARRIREDKSSVGQGGNKTQSSSSDASLYIPPQLTGSLLDSVNENPDRARAAKLIFDQYAA